MTEFTFGGQTYVVSFDKLKANNDRCYVFHPTTGWMILVLRLSVFNNEFLFVDEDPTSVSTRGTRVLVAHRLGGDQKLILALEATYDNESAFALLRKASRAPFWHRFLVWSALVLSITLVALVIATNFGH